jgi:hypothetical protein
MSVARPTGSSREEQSPRSKTGNRVRAAALVAALVPLAQVTATPVTVSAQCSGCPPPSVPEPSTLLLLAPAAAAILIRRRMKK